MNYARGNLQDIDSIPIVNVITIYLKMPTMRKVIVLMGYILSCIWLVQAVTYTPDPSQASYEDDFGILWNAWRDEVIYEGQWWSLNSIGINIYDNDTLMQWITITSQSSCEYNDQTQLWWQQLPSWYTLSSNFITHFNSTNQWAAWWPYVEDAGCMIEARRTPDYNWEAPFIVNTVAFNDGDDDPMSLWSVFIQPVSDRPVVNWQLQTKTLNLFSETTVTIEQSDFNFDDSKDDHSWTVWWSSADQFIGVNINTITTDPWIQLRNGNQQVTNGTTIARSMQPNLYWSGNQAWNGSSTFELVDDGSDAHPVTNTLATTSAEYTMNLVASGTPEPVVPWTTSFEAELWSTTPYISLNVQANRLQDMVRDTHRIEWSSNQNTPSGLWEVTFWFDQTVYVWNSWSDNRFKIMYRPKNSATINDQDIFNILVDDINWDVVTFPISVTFTPAPDEPPTFSDQSTATAVSVSGSNTVDLTSFVQAWTHPIDWTTLAFERESSWNARGTWVLNDWWDGLITFTHDGSLESFIKKIDSYSEDLLKEIGVNKKLLIVILKYLAAE